MARKLCWSGLPDFGLEELDPVFTHLLFPECLKWIVQSRKARSEKAEKQLLVDFLLNIPSLGLYIILAF
jgi:hypothetical protein